MAHFQQEASSSYWAAVTLYVLLHTIPWCILQTESVFESHWVAWIPFQGHDNIPTLMLETAHISHNFHPSCPILLYNCHFICTAWSSPFMEWPKFHSITRDKSCAPPCYCLTEYTTGVHEFTLLQHSCLFKVMTTGSTQEAVFLHNEEHNEYWCCD